MKQIVLIILSGFFTFSIGNISGKSIKKTAFNQVMEKTTNDTAVQSANLHSKLKQVFHYAVKSFPKDSAALYRFYFKWNPAKGPKKLKSQIKRLENLTSRESIKRYKNVEQNLKPLLKNIIKKNSVTEAQADSLAKLYSDYDQLSSESLFSNLLTEKDNYNLVWNSFQIMANENTKDTCYISALIILENHISTNAELAEEMPDYVVKAIQNNPLGFLEMYNQRKGIQRKNFADYITKYDDPDAKLVKIYKDISQNSTNIEFKKLATELLSRFKE